MASKTKNRNRHSRRSGGRLSRAGHAIRGAISNSLEATIGIISPARALHRQHLIKLSEYLDKRHENRMSRLESGESLSSVHASGSGGFNSARNTPDAHSWLTSRLSIDAALEYDLEEMRFRSDSAYKNYELARAHVERRTQRVVGCGIGIRPAVRKLKGVLTKSQAKAINRQLNEHLERILPRIGHHGEPFHVIQRLVQRHWEKDGEAFVLFGDKPDAMSPITLKIEVIHPQRVMTPPNQSTNPLVRMGVVYNRRGDVVGYFVRSVHPGDNKIFVEKFDFIPSKFQNGLPRMLHLYDKLEAGQSRGYPHLQVALRRLKNSEEYEDAEMERNLVAACHAAFVTTEASPDQLAELYGTESDAVTGRRYEDIEPAMIKYLSPLEKVEFNNPPGPQGNFVPYIEHQGRMAASGVGSSYEMMSGNWKGLSYSAAKAIWNDEQIPIDCRRKDLISSLLVPTYQHVVTRCVTGLDLVGIDPVFYRSEPWHFWRARFVAPKKYLLDPQREGAADERDVANVFAVASDIVEQGTGEDRKDRASRGIANPEPRMSGGTKLGDENPEAADPNAESEKELQAAG